MECYIYTHSEDVTWKTVRLPHFRVKFRFVKFEDVLYLGSQQTKLPQLQYLGERSGRGGAFLTGVILKTKRQR